ncbi:tetratricopeptide repeat protein [Spirillospora sp. CA-253888]
MAAAPGRKSHVRPPYAPWHPAAAFHAERDLAPVRAAEGSASVVEGACSSWFGWDRASALASQGYAARAAGDLERGARLMRGALSLFGALDDLGSARPVYVALIELHFAAGDYTAAADVAREALTLFPGHQDARVGLAYARWYEGHSADAITLLSEAVADEPGKRAARRARGQILADLGRAMAALADLDPDDDDPDARSALALALDALGRIDEADRELDRALDLAPDRPRTHLRSARIALRRGDTRLARESLQRTLAGRPPLPPAHAAEAQRLLRAMPVADPAP